MENLFAKSRAFELLFGYGENKNKKPGAAANLGNVIGHQATPK